VFRLLIKGCVKDVAQSRDCATVSLWATSFTRANKAILSFGLESSP
jgi:hypothetical protein